VFDEVPTAVPATLSILAALRPDLAPLRQAFTSLVGPVIHLALHGCDIQNFSTALRSLVNFGTVPGGHWGPNVGFPVAIVASPQEGGTTSNSYPPYPVENDAYPAPCEYSPGPTIPGSTLADTLLGWLP
jgi:hypothetical protein